MLIKQEVITKAIPIQEGVDVVPIQENVGVVRPDGFEIDLNKMHLGRRYFFNYGPSKYEAQKSETGKLLLSEIG